LLAIVHDFDVAAGRKGSGQLLDLDEPPTAMITASAMQAVGVLQEARHRGLDVPGDLAVVGYADVDVTRSTHPPLTMVSFPTFDVGRAAMGALQQMIAGEPRKPERVVFPGTLEIRESCGQHPIEKRAAGAAARRSDRPGT
jgi:LacI family transcriptional regulator, galactose operon repressor